MLMTRDNPSIATNVKTITSSVIILSIGNVRMKHFCHRLVGKKWILGQLSCSECVPALFLLRYFSNSF